MVDYLHVDAEPRLVQITSEPYVIYTGRGYQPVVDVYDRKRKAAFVMFISSKTLSQQIERLRQENNGLFTGLEFWIRKKSYEKTAPYIIEAF